MVQLYEVFLHTAPPAAMLPNDGSIATKFNRISVNCVFFLFFRNFFFLILDKAYNYAIIFSSKTKYGNYSSNMN